MYFYDQYLKLYLNILELEGYSKNTIKVYKNVLSKLFFTLNKNISEITINDIRNYLSDYKQKNGISNKTLSNYQHYISAYFKWLYKEGYLDKNPCENLHPIKVPKRIKDGFTQEEMEQIRSACHSVREAAIIEFLYSSGVRASELINLNKEDINWERNKTIVLGKGQKEREVYFTPKAAELLKKYLSQRSDTDPALFVSYHSPFQRITIDSLESTLKTIGKRCGLHIYPHRFRHTCATTLLENEMPVQEVSEILGHSSIDTTMIYCTLNKNKIAKDYAKCIK